MTILTATFAAISVSAAQDVFELVAPAGSRVALREIKLGQYSDFGDTSAEILSVTVLRGYTVTGSGGAALTPVALNNLSQNASGASTLARNNTTVATTGGVILVSDIFNIQGGWWYRPPDDERIELSAGQRLVVRITAPADAITMNGSIVFEEVGQA